MEFRWTERFFTSDTLNVMIAGEARRAGALLKVTEHRTFGVHAAGILQVAGIVALTLYALFCQAAFFVVLAGRCGKKKSMEENGRS